jgi:transposase
MSCNELTRLRVLIDVADGRLSVADATGLIGVGRRQIYRLLQAFRADGPDGLISRKRGGPSNRALGSVRGLREQIAARQSNPGHSADHSAAQSAAKEPTADRPRRSEHGENYCRGADPEL